MLEIISFFAGAGLLDYGLINAGYKILESSEINKNYRDCYKFSHRDNMPIYGINNFDFREYWHNLKIRNDLKNKIKYHRKNSLVGIVGGSPCIDFSIAGNNKGKKGLHGSLFGGFCSLIDEVEPNFFIIENVSNLAIMHREYLNEQILILLKKFNVVYTVVNALEYGCPQHRERLIIYGHNKKLSPQETINFNEFKKYNIADIKKINWPKASLSDFGTQPIKPRGLIEDLTVDYWFNKNNNHYNKNQFYLHKPHLDTTLKEGERRKQSYKRLHRYKFSDTLAHGHYNMFAHPYELRGISIGEALIIQSMPNSFILPLDIPKNHLYQTISNGVPFLLSKGIGEAIKKHLLSC